MNLAQTPVRSAYTKLYGICLLTSYNTKERVAQNIYIRNSNKNYQKLTATTILIKKRIGISYKNYKKPCPGLEFRLISELISWPGLKPKNSSRLLRTNKLQQLKKFSSKIYDMS